VLGWAGLSCGHSIPAITHFKGKKAEARERNKCQISSLRSLCNNVKGCRVGAAGSKTTSQVPSTQTSSCSKARVGAVVSGPCGPALYFNHTDLNYQSKYMCRNQKEKGLRNTVPLVSRASLTHLGLCVRGQMDISVATLFVIPCTGH
jgi:hypothetical protein